MDSETLLDEFISGRIRPEQFGHREHVMVAYQLLGMYPFENAVDRFASGAGDLARGAGAPEKFHFTLTRALMVLIDSDRRGRNQEPVEDYLESKPEVLCNAMAVISRHYSAGRLWSPTARQSWIEPDLAPLPLVLEIKQSEVA